MPLDPDNPLLIQAPFTAAALALFDDGLAAITGRTGWPSFGVVPWFADAALLPAEDAVALDRPVAARGAGAAIVIAVPKLSRIANFDDLDPLRAEASVDLRIIQPGRPLPGDADIATTPRAFSDGAVAPLRPENLGDLP